MRDPSFRKSDRSPKPSASTSFPLQTVQAMRSAGRGAVQTPEKGRRGWTLSAVDPGKIVGAFPTLRIDDRYQLVGYLFFDGQGNGNGVVHAIPKGPVPKPKDCRTDKDTALDVPVPNNALPSVMDAIEGDGSPLSYLSASLLLRELHEFGAMWHGLWWSSQSILGGDPRIDQEEFRSSNWQWTPAVEGLFWEPTVSFYADEVTTSFVTFCGAETERVTYHLDRYPLNRYTPQLERLDVGVGPMGFIY